MGCRGLALAAMRVCHFLGPCPWGASWGFLTDHHEEDSDDHLQEQGDAEQGDEGRVIGGGRAQLQHRLQPCGVRQKQGHVQHALGHALLGGIVVQVDRREELLGGVPRLEDREYHLIGGSAGEAPGLLLGFSSNCTVLWVQLDSVLSSQPSWLSSPSGFCFVIFPLDLVHMHPNSVLGGSFPAVPGIGGTRQ